MKTLLRRTVSMMALSVLATHAHGQQTTPFTSNHTYATLSVSNTAASAALPSGPVVLIQNTGSSAVSCSTANSQAAALAGLTVSQIIVQPANRVLAGVPLGDTWIACIDITGSGTNTVVVAGGNGAAADLLTDFPRDALPAEKKLDHFALFDDLNRGAPLI